MRLVILGHTGMLGSEVLRVSTQQGLDVLTIGRSGALEFDATSDSLEPVLAKAQITGDDLLVNCIGWIPQKASGVSELDQKLAFSLNTALPESISQAKKIFGFRWLQIGTDCVFSGKSGGYREDSEKDATDLYGRSKVAGEEFTSEAIQVRCSIIGPDSRTSSGLYSWFKSQAISQNVPGYSNHFWNGVTTHAFSKLAVGLLKHPELETLDQNWLPRDYVSKKRLLELFSMEFGWPVEKVVDSPAPIAVDRRLDTKYPDMNLQLWAIAGYKAQPSVEELVHEMIEIDRGAAIG